MDVEAALELAKRLIVAQSGKHLNDLQIYVLQGALEGKTLSKIAESHSYNDSHVKEVSAKLWTLLTAALGESVTKRNLRSVLEQRLRLEEQKSKSKSLLDEAATANNTSNGQGVVNISLPELSDSCNKYQRGVWIPNLRCRKVWGRDSFSEEV